MVEKEEEEVVEKEEEEKVHLFKWMVRTFGSRWMVNFFCAWVSFLQLRKIEKWVGKGWGGVGRGWKKAESGWRESRMNTHLCMCNMCSSHTCT